jgi:two-component system CheB/CheR fusion protein
VLPLDGGSTYLARIQPYRTLDNVNDGVVRTFTDISSRVQAEAAVEEARRVAESIVDAVREPLLVLDASMKVTSASRSFYETFQVKPEETVGRSIFELGDGQWDIPELRRALTAVQVEGRAFDTFAIERQFPRVGARRLVLNGRSILGKSAKERMILLAMEPAANPPKTVSPGV